MAPCCRLKQKLPVQALRSLHSVVAIYYLRVLFCATRAVVVEAVAAIWPVPLENQLTIGNKFSLYHVLSLREAVTKCLYVWDEIKGQAYTVKMFLVILQFKDTITNFILGEGIIVLLSYICSIVRLQKSCILVYLCVDSSLFYTVFESM